MGKFQDRLGDEVILFARQSAWLAAAPRPKKERQGATEPKSRLEQFQDDGEWPPLPDCSAMHLYTHLMDAGPYVSGSMGGAPLGWSELGNWQQQTGIRLQPWELRILRQASREYLAELRAAEEPDRPPPWRRPERTEKELENEAVRLERFFDMIEAYQQADKKKAAKASGGPRKRPKPAPAAE